MMCFTHSLCQLTALYQLYQLLLFWSIHVYWFDFLSMVTVMTYGPFYYKLILCHRKHNHVSITIIGKSFIIIIYYYSVQLVRLLLASVA